MTQTPTRPKLKEKTTLQKEREARNFAIYKEYNELAANPKQSRVALNEYLMAKYDIHSPGTLYLIRRRVEERLKAINKEG